MGSKANILLKELTSASVLLALFTSLLYISGSIYLATYLEEWGINSSLVPTTTQDILMQGAGIFILGGAHLITYAAIAVVSIFVLVHIFTLLFKGQWLRKFVAKIREIFVTKPEEKEKEPEALRYLVSWSDRASAQMLIVLVVFYFLIEMIIYSGVQAKERAAKEYSAFSTGKVADDRMFDRKATVSINSIEIVGYVIASTEKVLAIYVPETSDNKEQIKVVPMVDVEYLVSFKMQHNNGN